MPKKRRVTKRVWVLFAIFVLTYSIILTQKSIRQAYTNFNRLDEEIFMNEKKLYRLKAILKQSSGLNSQYQELFAGYKGINDPEGLLQEIGAVAKKLNLNITSIKPALTKMENKYKIYSIKIESQDDVLTLAKFIHNLSEELKNVGVERLQIKAQGKEELPKISMTLDAVVF
jgi:Tfp pilus assembly protein PilO